MNQRMIVAMRVGLLMALGLCVTASRAATYEFCVLGQGPAFTKTIHLKLFVEGEDPMDKADLIAAELTKRLLWADKAERAFAELYSSADCSAAHGLEAIEVTLTDGDISALSIVMRGPNKSEALFAAIAKRSVRLVAMDGDPKPPTPRPNGDGEPYHVVRVFYATNRTDTEDAKPSERFGNERETRLPRLHYGAANVSIPKHHRKGELESPAIWKLEFRKDPEKHVVLVSIDSFSRDDWRRELKRRATQFGKPGVLLFIHGYKVSFSDAAERAGQLAYDLAFAGPTVFFAWPSQGSLAKYTVDEQKAEQSIPDMKDLLADLADLVPRGPVYVIAHSMGSRVLTNGFKELMADHLDKRRSFKEIILAAPDIDATVFKDQIAPKILGMGPRVTLYASSEDKALGVSGGLVHGGPRLGKLQQNGAGMTVLLGMDSVDASNVETDFLSHSFFAGNRTVLSDLIDLIRNGVAPDRRPDLEPVPGGNYWRFRP